MIVPYLDLKVYDHKLKKELLECVERVIDHGWIIEGKEQSDFEERFAQEIGVKYALGVGSGSSALYLALLSAGIGPGDEVITTPFTWIITVNAIVATGATPVFVDINEDYNIAPDKIEKAITNKTKAIVPMHVAGHMCDMRKISKIAKQYKLIIVEDAAQAFCSSIDGRRAGTFSTAAAFSMNPMKILHAYGEAGAVVTNSKNIYNTLRQLRHAGTKRDEEGIHINRCNYVSLNHKIDTIQASMLMLSMDRIAEIKATRDKIAMMYDEALSNIVNIQKVGKKEIHGRYIYLMACKKRDNLRNYLIENNIENKIFYSPLACDAEVYSKLNKEISIPTSRRMLDQSLSIPLHEKMSIQQAEYVIDTIHKFYN